MADPLVVHLLRRATFGPTASEVDAADRAGFDATLNQLLNPTGADLGANPVPALGPDPYASLGRNPSDADRQKAQQARREQIMTVEQWWLTRMVAARHQFTEKLVFFWHGHWATSVQKVKSGPLMLNQLNIFRTRGRGDTAALVKAMLRDPALILWLDGQRNTRQAPNENLSRELMELFTLGIGGGYTEDDIKAGARALTGWTIDRTTGTATLAPNRHDAGSKTILGVTAAFNADSYADLLVAQPAHAIFLARRLWFRFASGEPLDGAVEARLAGAYRSSRDVIALARALFTDSAFAATRGQLVKQPVEWLVGAIRQLGLESALSGDKRRQLLGGLDGLGQVPLRPPSVGGWPSGAAWLTTSSLQVRLRVAGVLASSIGPAVTGPLGTGSPEARIAALARLLVVDAWTDRTRAALTEAAGDARRLLTVGLVSPEYTVS
jgi:uncharacterized protein (DUF1800 family)